MEIRMLIKKLFKKFVRTAIILAALLLVSVYAINSYMVDKTESRIYSRESLPADSECDCILILGCSVRPNGTPSSMLADRLDEGIALYKKGAAKKIIMSGDHGRRDYDEVEVMKNYAIKKGVPSKDIFKDHAGFSTYESIYRAKEVFCADNVIIVTQLYHMYRAIHIADSLGVKAVGVNSDPRSYLGHQYNELREMAARTKDFAQCIVKPKPTYLGDAIPVSGNGNVTDG